MANFIITKIIGEDFIRVTSNDEQTSWEYVDIWPNQLLGLYKYDTGIVGMALDQGQIWSLSVDGAGGSHKVDSVDENIPADNDDLIDLIRALRPKLQ